MWVSPKKYILTADNEVKEAGPGVSGTVLVGEGAEMPEEEARRYGILNDGKQSSTQEPATAKPPVVRDNQPSPKEINFGKVIEENREVKPWKKKSEETALPTE